MDMSASNPAVAGLSLSDPNCVKAAEACTAFYAAENASQAAIPWASLFKYGHWTTYYWVVVLGLVFLGYVFLSIKDNIGDSSRASNVPGLYGKAQAVGRLAFYRRFPSSPLSRWLDPPPNFGVAAFLLVTIVFLLGVAFGPRPYYREHLGYGSPPLGVRTGLMSLACLPIIVALSGKANVVTLFTGISHERLNILHRWVAWMSFGLSLVHTFPFFYAALNDPGWGGAPREHYEMYKGGWTGDNQLNGIPPLAILFAMCILSLPQVRNRAHEVFYLLHVVLAITYLGLMYWHATGGDSWDYLWATLAIWLASWLARIFWKTQPLNIHNEWFSATPANLTVLPGNVTRVEVFVPRSFHWKPAQHVFVRFTDINVLDNHPFTIASAPSVGEANAHNTIVILARSHTGFTHRLASFARSKSTIASISTRVWLDGPYGGLTRPLYTRFDTLVLVAGGTGISACLPWLLDFLASATTKRLRRVVLIWAIRHEDALSWISPETKRIIALRAEKHLDVTIHIHITGSTSIHTGELHTKFEAESPAPSDEITPEIMPSSGLSEETINALGTVVNGRPNMMTLLQEFVRAGERSIVFGCGPEGFRVDLANATASAQKRVLKGECSEIKLHLETYGW